MKNLCANGVHCTLRSRPWRLCSPTTFGHTVAHVHNYLSLPHNTATMVKATEINNDPTIQDPPTHEKSETTTNGTDRRIMSLAEVDALTQVQDDDTEIGANALYRSGIAALRSSAHRVKAKNRKHNPKPRTRSGQESVTTHLPNPLYREEIFGFDMEKYNLRQLFTAILKKLDRDLVGTFRGEDEGKNELEDFILPTTTLHRKVNGGCCESTQAYMSEAVAKDEAFLEVFDKLIEEVVVPRMKRRLIEAGAASEDEPLSFFIQRPPTLRLQPGPGRVGKCGLICFSML